jgi:hypothetical protein
LDRPLFLFKGIQDFDIRKSSAAAARAIISIAKYESEKHQKDSGFAVQNEQVAKMNTPGSYYFDGKMRFAFDAAEKVANMVALDKKNIKHHQQREANLAAVRRVGEWG